MLTKCRSIFPAGTVSGAPKVRAMELIGELEREKRGIYAGAVGYFGYNTVSNGEIVEGSMDTYDNPQDYGRDFQR